MKRLLVRLAILSGVAVLGLIAMAQAQRGAQTASPNAGGAPSPSQQSTLSEPFAAATSSDPFANGNWNDGRGASGALSNDHRLPPPRPQPATSRGTDGAREGLNVRPVRMQTVVDDNQQPLGATGGSGAQEDPFAKSAPGGTSSQRGTSALSSPPAVPSPALYGDPPGGASSNPLRKSGNVNGETPKGFAPRNAQAISAVPANTGDGGGLNKSPLGADPFNSPARGLPSDDMSPTPTAREPLGQQFPGGPAAGGAGVPGAPQLEGSQLPTLTVQKFAPPEIQVNKPCTFEIHVRNTGQAPARDVEVFDRVPKGTQLLGAVPPAQQTPQGDLVWRLDTLPPGDQRVIKLQLRPLARGEIGSVATVRFGADASVRTKCTAPELRIEMGAARQTLIGDNTVLQIKVTNMGDGPATGVLVAEQVPPNFEHPQGQVLENDLGTLKPQESRELRLTLRAVKPGTAVNRFVAKADGEVRVEKELPIEVIAPALALDVKGPEQRFLEREAIYEINLHNPGTAPAKTVQLTAYVPPGFKFIGANNYGEFDAKTRRVAWELVELPAGQTDRVEIKLVPIEAGNHELHVEGRAQRNVLAARKMPVAVDGVVNLQFEVFQPPQKGGALEVNGQTAYEIRVVNNGSKAATNVQVAVLMPPGLQPGGGKGPTTARSQGNQVLFDPLPRLAPRADTTFVVYAKATTPGDHRVQFHIGADELQKPVMKEESTSVR
jgi:uncharacterized repeat protein (TIGR01451 family)